MYILHILYILFLINKESLCVRLALLSPMVTVCVTGITIREICILSTEGIPVACIKLRTRGDFFLHMQHSQIGNFCS